MYVCISILVGKVCPHAMCVYMYIIPYNGKFSKRLIYENSVFPDISKKFFSKTTLGF